MKAAMFVAVAMVLLLGAGVVAALAASFMETLKGEGAAVVAGVTAFVLAMTLVCLAVAMFVKVLR